MYVMLFLISVAKGPPIREKHVLHRRLSIFVCAFLPFNFESRYGL